MPSQPSVQKTYLDVCALSRLFDDQVQARVRLETEAVKLILSHVRAGTLRLIVSPAHRIEISAIKNLEERKTLEGLLTEIGTRPSFDLFTARRRAEALTLLHIGPADAAHLALAEQAGADFISVDDRLLKRAGRIKWSVWLGTPVQFCEKEMLR
jgi:predicted nucleic acid-binding protein